MNYPPPAKKRQQDQGQVFNSGPVGRSWQNVYNSGPELISETPSLKAEWWDDAQSVRFGKLCYKHIPYAYDLSVARPVSHDSHNSGPEFWLTLQMLRVHTISTLVGPTRKILISFVAYMLRIVLGWSWRYTIQDPNGVAELVISNKWTNCVAERPHHSKFVIVFSPQFMGRRASTMQ